MSIQDFRTQIAAATSAGQLTSLFSQWGSEFAAASKDVRSMVFAEWCAKREELLGENGGERQSAATVKEFPSGFRVGAGDALVPMVPDGSTSCHRHPSERLAEGVSSSSAGSRGTAREPFQFANTETKPGALLPSVVPPGESSKGLDRDGYKPLMQNRNANVALPDRHTDGNTFSAMKNGFNTRDNNAAPVQSDGLPPGTSYDQLKKLRVRSRSGAEVEYTWKDDQGRNGAGEKAIVWLWVGILIFAMLVSFLLARLLSR